MKGKINCPALLIIISTLGILCKQREVEKGKEKHLDLRHFLQRFIIVLSYGNKYVLLVFCTIGNTRISWQDGRCSVSCRAFKSDALKKNYVRTIVNQITRTYLTGLSSWVFLIYSFWLEGFGSKGIYKKKLNSRTLQC